MVVRTEIDLPQPLRTLFADELVESLVTLRRDLHQHPELSLKEERTAITLYQELAKLEPVELDRVAGTGVVARIRGGNPDGPCVAVRGDIDALPIHEDTGLPFSSVNDGVMHACGHDVHATWTIGAAHLLAKTPAVGDVLIVLQPAEELGVGAPAILESGVLDGVAAIFGAHVDRRFEIGQVVVQEGAMAAASDSFEIHLRGTGAHGARPHEARDPVVGLAALIGSLQTVVSRRMNPADPAVVTIGSVHAGNAPNVIPEEAILAGTMRALEPDVRERLKEEVRRMIESVADAYHLEVEIEVKNGTPPIVNPPRPVGWAREAVVHTLGEPAITPLPTINMGGEDFAYYLERMDGCFMRIGAREPGGEVIPAHSSYFYAADEAIFVGAAVLAETARRASAAIRSQSS